MPILAFHNIDNHFHPGINAYSPRRLRDLISTLQDTGNTFIKLSDYVGNDPSPRKISVTFDDGFESFYENAFEILTDLSVSATIFIPAAYIGKPNSWDYTSLFRKSNHLSATRIRNLASKNMEIGSHGHTHTNLRQLSDRLLKIELERSRKTLEDITGKKVRFLSYPFSRFDDRVECFCLEAGYERGFSLSHLKRSRIGFTIPRFPVYSIDTLYSISKKLSGGAMSKIEMIKGAIVNSYSNGTILLNRFRPQTYKEAY